MNSNNNQDKSGIDWQGLFNWSTQFHDNTKESEFEPMKEEERAWLEEAMKAYTFDDVNRLTEITKEMATEVENGFEGKKGALLHEMLEELMEIIELHERNSLNMVKCGGFETLLKFMITHPDAEARKLSCQIFSCIVQNQHDVQKFAMKLNSLTLL